MSIPEIKTCLCINDNRPQPDTLSPADTVLVTDDRNIASQFRQKDGCVIGLVPAEDIHEISFPEADALITETEALTEPFVRRTFCHHHKLPFTVAETARLQVRETIPADYDELSQMLRSSDDNLYSEGYDRDIIESKEGFEKYINTVYRILGFGIWSVVRRDDDRIIGWCGLFLSECPKQESGSRQKTGSDSREEYGIELGYLIGSPYRGHGYAKEACEAILAYTFGEIGVNRVMLRTARENTDAIRLAQHLGFTQLSGGEKCFCFEMCAPI